jgi:hypothetical protein
MMDTEYVALAAQEYGSIINHTTCERPKSGYGSKMMNAMPATVTERSRKACGIATLNAERLVEKCGLRLRL